MYLEDLRIIFMIGVFYMSMFFVYDWWIFDIFDDVDIERV